MKVFALGCFTLSHGVASGSDITTCGYRDAMEWSVVCLSIHRKKSTNLDYILIELSQDLYPNYCTVFEHFPLP